MLASSRKWTFSFRRNLHLAGRRFNLVRTLRGFHWDSDHLVLTLPASSVTLRKSHGFLFCKTRRLDKMGYGILIEWKKNTCVDKFPSIAISPLRIKWPLKNAEPPFSCFTDAFSHPAGFLLSPCFKRLCVAA